MGTPRSIVKKVNLMECSKSIEIGIMALLMTAVILVMKKLANVFRMVRKLVTWPLIIFKDQVCRSGLSNNLKKLIAGFYLETIPFTVMIIGWELIGIKLNILVLAKILMKVSGHTNMLVRRVQHILLALLEILSAIHSRTLVVQLSIL